MKKAELKKVLKPIVKECIQEALLEEGLLSNLISEVVKGLGANHQPIFEKKKYDNEIKKLQMEEKKKRSQKMNETRKKMLDAIGKSSYNGVNVFEGVEPARESDQQSPLANIAPGDPGVDITGLFNSNWSKLI